MFVRKWGMAGGFTPSPQCDVRNGPPGIHMCVTRPYQSFYCRRTLRGEVKTVRKMVLAALAAGGCQWASEINGAELVRPAMPVKAPPSATPQFDWSGYYGGAHLGYAAGQSNWTATGGTPLAGTFNFFSPYEAFKGTGSYFGGVQLGYNIALPSHLLIG